MLMSPLPYQSQIPFIRLESVQISDNVDNELTVQVQISNETKEIIGDEAREFGNFIYLSTDKNAIMNLAVSGSLQKALIMGAQPDTAEMKKYRLSLTKKDMNWKGRMADRPPGISTPAITLTNSKIYNHITQKTFVLNRVAGGNIMTGLIADAHIDRVMVEATAGPVNLAPLPPVQTLGIDVADFADRRRNTQIKDLYLFAVSYRTYKNNCFIGNVIKETLLVNGVSPPQAKLWKIETDVGPYGAIGSVWPGDIHYAPVTNLAPYAMVGTVHSSTPHPKIGFDAVPNSKVKDLRFLTTARTLKFEYAEPSQSDASSFSRLTLSRDGLGRIHGTFGFDLKQYAKNNTKYGSLIKNDPALLSCVKIEDIQISRRVIKRDDDGNELTPAPAGNLTIPGESGWTPISADSVDGAQPIRILNLSSNQLTDVKNIIFVDKGAALYVSSTVEYKVEVTVLDKTADALKALQGMLQTAISRDFSGKDRLPVEAENPVKLDLSNIISQYLIAVNFLFGTDPFKRFGMDLWSKNLLALAVPKPPGISQEQVMIVDLVRDFAAQISQQLTTGQAASDTTFQVFSSIAHPKPPSVLTVEHEFRDRYTIDRPAGVGVEYTYGMVNSVSSTTPNIGFETFSDRTKNEQAKYGFDNASGEINTYGYLSPWALLLGIINGQENLRRTESFVLDPARFTLLFINNALHTYQYNPNTAQTVEGDILEILSAAGAYIKHLDTDLRQILFPTADRVTTLIDPSDYMGTENLFNIDDESEGTGLAGSSEAIFIEATLPGNIPAASPAAQWLLNGVIVADNLPTIIRNPDAIAGSLALAKYTQEPSIIDNSNSLSNMINFESLVKVEYLKSYNTSQGAPQAIWETLNLSAFGTALDQGNSLLCRLVSISGVIDVDVDLGLSAMNTLFILGNPQFQTSAIRYGAIIRETGVYISTLSSNPYAQAGEYASNIPVYMPAEYQED